MARNRGEAVRWFFRHHWTDLVIGLILLLALVVFRATVSADYQYYEAALSPAARRLVRAVVIVGVLVAILLWRVPKWQVSRLKGDISAKDRGELEATYRTTLGKIAGAAAVIVGLYFTWQTFKLDTLAANAKIYGEAVARLEHDNIGEKLGGIETLAWMARNPRYHWSVMEQLTCYLRTKAERTDEAPAEEAGEDVQAILRVLRWRNYACEKEEECLDLSQTNLVGGCLNGAHLEKANLQGANLSNAHLMGAHLTRANVGAANLECAELQEADLERTYLWNANLRSAKLGQARGREAGLAFACLACAKARKAELVGADLEKANLWIADFSGANLDGACLKRAKLWGALLTHASLIEADLTDADLRSFDSLTDEDLDGLRAWLNEAYGDQLQRENRTAGSMSVADIRKFLGMTPRGSSLASRPATLGKADMTGAVLEGTHLRGVDLRQVEGLTREQLERAADVDWNLTPFAKDKKAEATAQPAV